ncbi:XkdW family protein [Paenibacillus sp. FSL R7-0297]|uniref:XkdW family protein n=1 Tax=Paenibacillus sp. FSL R7-0297 TaxID=2921680 RepID=UPI0030FA3FBD
MNISQAIKHLHPTADPMRDFMVQDNGPEPVLRPGAEEKGRVRYEIKTPDFGDEPVEGIHYRYGIDYNLLVEGEDYDLVGSGPFIAVWNLDAPQPTEAELQAAWEAYQEYVATKPPELTEMEQLQQENLLLKAQNNALSERADFIEDIIAEMAMQVYP